MTAPAPAHYLLDNCGRVMHAFAERDSEGFRLDDDWHVMGQRATVSGSPFLAAAQGGWAERASEGPHTIHRHGRRHGLSRPWRNARTHASHVPAGRKYHHVGNYLLNQVLPPNHGQI